MINNNKSVFNIDGKFIYSETLEMPIPAGGAHVRQVEFMIPRCKLNPDTSPMVNATTTVYSIDSPGNVFGVWNITIVDDGAGTIIKVSATNVNTGVPVPFTYVCSLIAIGTPYEAKAVK